MYDHDPLAIIVFKGLGLAVAIVLLSVVVQLTFFGACP